MCADIALRPTEESDIGALIEAERDSDTSPWLGEVSAAWHRQAISAADMQHLAIVTLGKLAGFVVFAGLSNPNRKIELRRIVVLPEFRGYGVGRDGLAAALDHAFVTLGAQQVWLDVKPGNARALMLYAKAGFARAVERSFFVEPDGSRTPLIVMSVEREAHVGALVARAFERAGLPVSEPARPSDEQALRIAIELEAALDRDIRASDVWQLGAASPVADFALTCVKSPSRAPTTAEPHPSDITPLSHAQERLLLAELQTPGGADTFLTHAHWLTGLLDLTALRLALTDVIRQHPALRTIFVWDENYAPGQRVLPAGQEFGELDVTARTDIDAGSLSLAQLGDIFCRDWWLTPFRLEVEPPFRARVVSLSPDRHVLCLAFHQIAVDSWSTRTVASDLGEAYVARCGGQPPSWQPAGSYRSFVWWERWQLSRCLEPDVRFWREALDGRTPLPLGPLGAGPETARCGHFVELSADDMRPLMRIGRRERLAVLMHSASEVLSDVLGEPVTTLGTLVSGRVQRVFHQVVGSFVNVMMVPVDLDDGAGCASHLRSLTTSLVACLDHSQTPFDEILRALPRARDGQWPGALVVLNDWFGLPDGAAVLEPEPTVLAGPSTTSALMLEAMVGHDGTWQIRGRWRGSENDETGRTLVRALAASLVHAARHLL